MSVMPVESRITTRLNTALLFCVAVEPFLFGLLTRPPAIPSASLVSFEGAASSLYALDMGIMMAVLGVFSLTLADEEKALVNREFAREFRLDAKVWFVGSAAFLISILPFFYTTAMGPLGAVRYYFWLVPIVTVWFRRASKAVKGEETPK
jgi:hypothetical protein